MWTVCTELVTANVSAAAAEVDPPAAGGGGCTHGDRLQRAAGYADTSSLRRTRSPGDHHALGATSDLVISLVRAKGEFPRTISTCFVFRWCRLGAAPDLWLWVELTAAEASWSAHGPDWSVHRGPWSVASGCEVRGSKWCMLSGALHNGSHRTRPTTAVVRGCLPGACICHQRSMRWPDSLTGGVTV